jgi:hypothetical protein
LAPRLLLRLGEGDGSRLLTACADGRARLWIVPEVDGRPGDDLARPARLLSSQHLHDLAAAAAIAPEALRAVWDDLRARYPSEFRARR